MFFEGTADRSMNISWRANPCRDKPVVFLASSTPGCDESGAQSGGKPGLLRNEHLDLQCLPDGENKSGILSASASENHVRFHFQSLDQHGYLGGHGPMHTRQNVLRARALGDSRDRLRFGEHCTVRGKFHRLPGFQGKGAISSRLT